MSRITERMLGDVKRSMSGSLVPFEGISTGAGRLVQVIVSPGMFRTLFSHESVRRNSPLSDNSVVEQRMTVKSVCVRSDRTRTDVGK